jgi:hypothetical protein
VDQQNLGFKEGKRDDFEGTSEVRRKEKAKPNKNTKSIKYGLNVEYSLDSNEQLSG